MLSLGSALNGSTWNSPIQVSLDPFHQGRQPTSLLAAILRANPRVSDLIFSPGKKCQIQVNGDFVERGGPACRRLPPMTHAA